LKNLEIQLDMLEKQTTFNELDMHISKAQISKAISKLKCGKSPGLDNSIFQSETPRRVGQQQSPSDLSLSVV
jgi:hypothetical protein